MPVGAWDNDSDQHLLLSVGCDRLDWQCVKDIRVVLSPIDRAICFVKLYM